MQRAKLEIALKSYTWMSEDTLHFFPKSKLSFRPWRLLNSCQTSVKSTQSISISEDSQPAIYHYPRTTWDCLSWWRWVMAPKCPFLFSFLKGFFAGMYFYFGWITAHYRRLHSQHLFALFSGGSRTLTQLERRRARGYYQIIFPPHCNIDVSKDVSVEV